MDSKERQDIEVVVAHRRVVVVADIEAVEHIADDVVVVVVADTEDIAAVVDLKEDSAVDCTL